jgi:hypothetical protein
LENIVVNSNRPNPSDAGPQEPNAWSRFWFTPTPLTGLRCLRFLSGLLFLAWLLSFVGHQAEFFSLSGFMDLAAIREARRQTEPLPAPIGWSILYAVGDNPQAFQGVYIGSLCVLALFTLGVATRITAPLTWIIVVSFLANPATSYESDYLLAILAFYMMIGHLFVGQWSGNLSPLERILGLRGDFVFAACLWPDKGGGEAKCLSHGANLALRLLQIHFAIIIVVSGLHKLQIPEWWGGVALWYPLHPTFKTTLESLRAEVPHYATLLFFLSILGYIVLAWQLAFPVFAWRGGRWRIVLLGGALIGWAAMDFLFQLPLVGPFVMICCLSYLRPEEWAWLFGRVKALMTSTAPKAAEPKKVAASSGIQSLKR